MDIEKRIDLIMQVGEEVVTPEELRELLSGKKRPIAYDGFEPSGRIHIAQGVMRAIAVNKLIQSGVHFKFWVADWFAWMNNKMGGDLDKIKTVGKYMVEVWKSVGMDVENVEFLWTSDAVKDPEYWELVVKIARNNTLNRIIRCSQIMGRKETDNLTAAQIFYPCMQCADIFWLKADITQLGMDQRKVNMLAREIGPKLGFRKPVVVSHHMLMGLMPPSAIGSADAVDRAIEMKMSKSIPDSSIFMTDSAEEVERKIKKAYCPEKQVHENPMMEYMKYIIFEKYPSVTIKRPDKFGGNLELSSYDELAKLYSEGKIHPLDLKSTVSFHINDILEPVRNHFEKNKKARELEEFVRNQSVTR